MSYDRPHFLIQWGGKLPGNEQWSCSVRMANSLQPGSAGLINPGEAGQIQDWLDDDIAPAVQAFHTNSDSHIHNTAKLSFVKANIVGQDGRYVDMNTHEHVFADVAGGSSGNQFPNQCALVVSLTTGFSRGPAHRGRFYLPMPSVQLLADGTILTGNCDQVAAAAKTFLEALSDTPGIDTTFSPNVCVMSKKSTGATNKVTGVEVGRVVDTQRRRRRSLVEDYQLEPVDLGAN